jgi:hypothetical protein
MDRNRNSPWRRDDLKFWAEVVLQHFLRRRVRADELVMLAAVLASEPDSQNRYYAVMRLAGRLPKGLGPVQGGRPPKNMREVFEQSDKLGRRIKEREPPPEERDQK